MKEYVRILGDGNFIDLVPINIVDGAKKRKNDIASRTAGRLYENHNTGINCHIRSQYSSHRRITELSLSIFEKHEKGCLTVVRFHDTLPPSMAKKRVGRT